MNEYDGVQVLLVEDSTADAEMTMRTLKHRKLANHIDWVRDGVEALEFLFREGGYADRPDHLPRLVLLDIKMPRMDGLETLRRLRADPRTEHLAVVMMTSSREGPDLDEAYRLKVNSYIVKPVDFEQFADTVAQLGMYWMVLNEIPARS